MGNDYGKDLLRQHYEQSHKSKDLLLEVDREPFEYRPLAVQDGAFEPVARAEHATRDR